MARRVALVLVALATLFGLPWSPLTSAASAAVPTACVVSSVQVGKSILLDASVQATGNVAATGSLTIEVTKGGGVKAWSTVQRYSGAPLRVTGPKASAKARVVTIRFTPDQASQPGGYTPGGFDGCVGSAQVGAGDIGGEEDSRGKRNGATGAAGGGLPNTGGPHLGLLLAGLASVLAGGALVGHSRRRPGPASFA